MRPAVCANDFIGGQHFDFFDDLIGSLGHGLVPFFGFRSCRPRWLT
jgi:hypothetical protein